MKDDFRPARGLRSGHAMTIAAALVDPYRRSPPGEIIERFRVDGESQVTAFCRWQPETSPDTVVLVHGLTGDASSGYLRATAAKAFAAGFNTVRLNIRNCGGTFHLTPTLYHSGLTDDVAAVLRHLPTPPERCWLVGFSMGGNIVLKLTGELGPDNSYGGVAAVSPAIALQEASAAIDRGWFNAIYQRHFLRDLQTMLRKKAELFPERYEVRSLPVLRTLRDFDNAVVAPAFGFEDADDYYRRASAEPSLDRIRVPVLVLHARDDSIVPAASIERWRRRAGPHVDIRVSEHGGHVGFIGRRVSGEDRFWAENRIIDWLKGQRAGLTARPAPVSTASHLYG